ncbi:MAG: NADPH-dependent FMN reductase [Phycisphaerales bacterium]
MGKIKVLAFAGSTREGSFNKKLARAALASTAAAGADTTFLDLRDLALPMYDEDLEAQGGLPASAKSLKETLRAHDAFIIASPEYNSSVSAVLKNAIDWASRPEPGQPSLSCFTNKVCALFAASPGALGGLRGLTHIRQILGNINVLLLPQQFALIKAHEAFDADGRLKDPKQQEMVDGIAKALVTITSKLKA